MSSHTPAMRTGDGGINVTQRAMMLALMGIYMEETCKTALIYTVHHNRTEVTPQDMLKALKYQMVSEQGCGNELKQNLQEVMETETIADIEEKPLAHRAVMEHLPQTYQSMAQQPTTSGQVRSLMTSILGPTHVSGGSDDNGDDGGSDGEGDDGGSDGEGDDGGSDDYENNGDDDGKNNGDDDGKNDESGDDDDDCCDCVMCTEIDQLYVLPLEPRDPVESMIMIRFQSLYEKHKNDG